MKLAKQYLKTILFLLFCTQAQVAYGSDIVFGYEDPLLRTQDESWMENFEDMSNWTTAQSRMDMYFLTRNMLFDIAILIDTNSNPTLLNNIRNFLQNKIVVLNDGTMQLNSNDGDTNDVLAVYSNTAGWMNKLYRSGIGVHAIAMQSPLSKGDDIGYPIEDSAYDCLHYAAYMKYYLKKLGLNPPAYLLIDASRAHNSSDWKWKLRTWNNTMITAGHRVTGILHDFPARHILEYREPADLVEALEFTSDDLNLDAFWHLSTGEYGDIPEWKSRAYLYRAIYSFLDYPGAKSALEGIIWDDFQNYYSEATPDTYYLSAMGVFNAIHYWINNL